MAGTSLSWGRIALGGFLAELVLILAVIPLQAAGSGDGALTTVAVAGSFVAFVPVAWWMGRRLVRPVLHGVLMGAFAAALYTGLLLRGTGIRPDHSALATDVLRGARAEACGRGGGRLAGAALGGGSGNARGHRVASRRRRGSRQTASPSPGRSPCSVSPCRSSAACSKSAALIAVDADKSGHRRRPSPAGHLTRGSAPRVLRDQLRQPSVPQRVERVLASDAA